MPSAFNMLDHVSASVNNADILMPSKSASLLLSSSDKIKATFSVSCIYREFSVHFLLPIIKVYSASP